MERGGQEAKPKACCECGISQALVAFRRCQGKRMDVCRTCERMPCAACAAMLPQHSFTSGDVHNHYSHERKVVCLECKKHGCSARRPELYPCAGPCNERLESAANDPNDLSSWKKDQRHRMRCKDCNKNASDREKHLQRLMKKSRRAECTCQRPLAQAGQCPMHMRLTRATISRLRRYISRGLRLVAAAEKQTGNAKHSRLTVDGV